MDPTLNEKLITTKDAGEISGYTSDYLSRLVRSGKIIGKRIGRSWVIDKESLTRFLDRQDTHNTDRARALASERAEEYRTHRSFLHRATKKLTESLSFSLDAAADIGHGVSHMSDMSERNLVKSSFRSQALALSVALFVVVSGALVARASALPHIAGDVAATLRDVAFGFDAAFGDIPARVALRIGAAKDDATEISSRVAAMNAAMTADIAPPLLAEPNLSSLQMALDDDRRATRVASVQTHVALSDTPLFTADDVREFARDVYAMAASPSRLARALVSAHRHIGERAYGAIGASFSAYDSLVETAGTKTLALAAAARDTLARAPAFVAGTNLALGEAVIAAAHAAIRADIAVSYSLAAAAPESARAAVALIGGAGAALADATAELPRLASSLFLRATAVPARVAPALARAAFDAEYAAAIPVVALSGQAAEGYLAVVRETGRGAYALAAGGSSLARATGATLAAAPSTIKDAYLGALGATALALSQPIHAITSVPQVAAALSAAQSALSPIERVALATYETIHDFFSAARRTLATLLGSFSNIAFAPRQTISTTPATLVATTTTRIVTVNNYTYPTYTTIARGVSADVMNESLSQLRTNILATVSGMIQPVAQQTATNATTIQYVNMIQKLDGLTVSNGIFTGGIFDSGIRVAATDASFTNLSAGTTNLGATTIASISSSGVTSYGQVIAPYFTATSTTATSTFAGRFAVGTSTPFGDGLFTLGTSTPLLFVSSNTGRIGFSTTTPDAMVGIAQISNGTPFISAYRATDTLSSGDFITYKSAAGTTLFRVDNSGNLLAGGIVNSGSQTITSVSTPQFRVQYDSSNEITTAVSSTGTTTIGIIGTAPSLSFTTSVNSVDTFKFTNAASTAILSIDTTNGRVGIGTTTPAWDLNVAGTRPSFALSDTSAGANLKHWLFSSLGGGLYIGTTTDAYATSTPSAFYISNAGRIGIGTVAPGTTFHINGTDGLVIPTGTTAQRPGTLVTGTVRYNSETSQFEGYGSTSWGSLGGVIDVDQDTKITAEDSAGADNDQLKFFTFGSERMRIDSNGNVGIGSTSPAYKFAVEGSSSLGNRAIAGYFTATTTTASSFSYASTTQLSAFGSLVVGGTSTSTIAGDYGASSIRGALTVYGNTTTGAASSLTLQRGSTNGDNTLTFNDQTGSPLLKLYSDANTGNARLVGYQSNLTLGTSVGGTALSIDTSSNINTTANIIPTANQTYDLGSASVYWRNSYIHNLVVNNLSSASTSIAGTNSTSFSINSNNPTSDTQDMSLIFYRGAGAPSNAVLSWNATLKRFEFNQNAYFANASASTGSTTIRVAAVAGQTGALTSWLDSSGNVLSTVAANGNFGIGTSTPNNKLDIYDTSKAAIGFSGASGPTYKWTLGEDMADAGKFKISSSTALGTSDRFVIDGSGLVGLGTSSPSVALDIASAKSGINIWANITSLYKKATVGYSDAVANDVFTISTNAPTGGTYQDIQIVPNNGTGNTGLYLNTSGQAGLGYTSFGDISLGTALLVNGRLGIGTTTPGSKLAVVANGRATGDLRYGLRIVNSDNANSQATGIAFSGNSANKWIIGTDINHDNSNNFYIATSSGPGASKAFVLNGEGSLTLADTGAAPVSAPNKLYSLAGALWWNTTQLTSGTAVNYWSHSSGITYTTTDTDKVGMGTTTPYAKLSIHANNGETNTTLFAIASSTASATTTLFSILNTGNVGIGTAGPGYLLDVQKDFGDTVGVALRLSNNSTVSSGTASTRLLFSSHTSASRDGGAIDVKNNTAGGDNMSMAFWVRDNANTLQERMRINAAGNVGIGTTSPNISAQTGTVLTIGNSSTNSFLELAGNRTSDLNVGGIDFINNTTRIATILGSRAGANNSGELQFYTNNAGGGLTQQMVISKAGNVGIGTTTPTEKLTIYGNAARIAVKDNSVSTDAINLGTDTSGNGVFQMYDSNGVQRVMLYSHPTAASAQYWFMNGNVGIGTTGPNAKLEVNDTAATAKMRIMGTGATTAELLFGGSTHANASVGLRHYSTGVGTGALAFLTSATDGALTEQVRILSNGNVGIGDTAPNYKLVVGQSTTARAFQINQGNDTNVWFRFEVDTATPANNIGYADGSWSGGGADVAEWYPTSYRQDLEPGDLVSIDTVQAYVGTTTIKSLVKKTVSDTDRQNVVGIVSTAPGLVAGSGDFGDDDALRNAHAVQVALAGRVPVKISTENGPVHMGDRITSSSLPGTGMKAATDGTTIGIALQNFDPSNGQNGMGITSLTSVNGTAVYTGKVLVLVNLDFSHLNGALTAATSTITNTSYLYATTTVTNALLASTVTASTTNTDVLCLSGDCRSSWPAATDLSGYVSTSTLATSLAGYALLTDIPNVSSFVSTSTLATSLASYATTANMNSALASYASAAGLASATSSIASLDSRLTTLEGAGYLTASALAPFVSTSTLASTLVPYVRFSDLASTTSGTLSGTVTGNIVPNAHNAYDLGSNSVRFANVYAQNLHAGDLTFTETTSAVSGNTFAVGDVVTLYVNSTSGSTHTVPIDFRTAINTTSYGANNVYFNTSGKFGIGIASTTALRGKLDVESAIATGADSRFLTLANSSSPAALPYSLSIPGGTGDLIISSNDNSTGSTVNASYPSWQLGLNGEADSFTIARAPAAAGITATNFFKVASSGNVGIGSSTPSQLLSVGGSALFSGSITATNLTATSSISTASLTITGATTLATSLSGLLQGASGVVSAITGTAGQFPYYNGANTLLATSTIFLATSGNFGVGTTTPRNKFSTNITSTAGVNGSVANSYPIAEFINTASDAGMRGLEIGAPTGSVVSPVYLKVSGTSARFSIIDSSNVENFTISSGNVGIGTTSPSSKLSIGGVGELFKVGGPGEGTGVTYSRTMNNGGDLLIGVDSSAGGAFFTGSKAYAGVINTNNNTALQFGTNNTARMIIDTTGNVGIGTTGPLSKLHVQTSGDNYITLDSTGATPGQGFEFREAGVVKGYILRQDGNKTSFYSGDGSTRDMVILDTGNVGIGTTVPGAPLQVTKGSAGGTTNMGTPIAYFENNGEAYIEVVGTSGNGSAVYLGDNTHNSAGGIYYTHSTGLLRLRTSGDATKDMVLNSSGNVGIGTTSPQALLHLSNSSVNGAHLRLDNSDTGGNIWEIISTGSGNTGGAGNLRLYNGTTGNGPIITSAGNVGIGTTNPGTYKLNVFGTVCLDLNADGVCTDTTSAISDARLKTNVTTITDGLSLVSQLHPVRFTWNGTYNVGTSSSLGFIAQEVETVFPELVITDTAGYKNLDYSKLTAVLAGAVQELNAKVDLLSASSTIGQYVVNNYYSTSTPTYVTNATSTTADLSGYALLTNLSDYLKTSDFVSGISSFVSTTTLATSLAGYALLTDIPNVSSFVSTSTLASYATNAALASYASAASLASATSSIAALDSRLTAAENDIAALAGGNVGISASSTEPGLGTLSSIAKWSFSSSTPWLAVENFLKPAAGIEPASLGIPSPGTDPLTGYLSVYTNIVADSLVATTSVWTNGLAVLGNGHIRNLSLGSGGLTFADGSLLASASGLVSTSTLSSALANIPSASLAGTVTGSMVPNAHNAYDLGSNSVRFANVYAQNLHAGDLTFTETTSAVSGNTFAVGDVVTLYVNSTSGSTHTVPIDFRTAINTTSYGANNVYFNTSGKFGIGIASTTALRGKLDVEGAITAGADSRFLTLANSSSPAALPYSLSIPGGTGDLIISSNDNSTGSTVNASYPSWQLGLNGETDSFTIARAPAAAGITATNFFKVASSGNVGIGSSTPSQLLSVGGSALFSGSITATNLTATSSISTASLTITGATTLATSLSGLLQGASGVVSAITGTAGQFPYYNGANTLLATSTIFLTTSGNVGIGTSTPYSRLSVWGNGTGATSMFELTNSASTTLASVLNDGTVYMKGNVGIGTTAPGAKLDVNGGINIAGDVTNSNGKFYVVNTYGYFFGGSSNLTGWQGSNGTQIIQGFTGGTEKMRLSAAGGLSLGSSYVATEAGAGNMIISGNVGIGTTGPGAPLHVVGNAKITGIPLIGAEAARSYHSTIVPMQIGQGGHLFGYTANPRVVLSANVYEIVTTGNWTYANTAAGAIASLDAGDFIINTTPSGTAGTTATMTERFRVTNTGNVGIGTTTPSSKLSIKQSAATYASGLTLVRHDNNDTFGIQNSSSNLKFGFDNGGTGSFSDLMTITWNGNVGIGTTDPSAQKLVVAGNVRVGTGTTGCVEDADGTLLAGTCSSDLRLKTNITPFGPTLDRLVALTPVTYNWRASEFPERHLGSALQTGLVAQDVAAQFPELVSTDDKGFEQIAFQYLPFYLLQGIKELDARTRQIIGSDGVLSLGASTTAQCVTGDTRLRRRRRRVDGSFEFEEVDIKDIAAGDEIASLDEREGKVVYSRVNALMDMGEQEVYELVTKSGRRIRTTSNHPFLAREGATKS